MASFRSLEDISKNMLDFLRVVQPDLDTKPGEVARDLFVDSPAVEISKLYIELQNITNLQSIAGASGTDLNLLARNFGLVRNGGSPATGSVIFTTNTLDSDIFIAAGTTVTGRNGVTYNTTSDTSFLSARENVYRSNAIRLRSDLELASITDEYALEVAVESNSFGTSGNIGKYSIITQSVPNVSNVTNVSNFVGGANSESDDAFRSRILGIFAGSNTGTALGYANAVLNNPGVVDLITVEPGDPLMTRDGTEVSVNDAGESIIISSGIGGKVDIYIQGSRLEEVTESYIYHDQSGKNDATDISNDFVLGQRGINPQLDFQQKRRLSISEGKIPFQPVDSIISVSGSSSGPNFNQKFVVDGEVKGSFELVKDDGNFGGSSFGFDRLHFISNKIELPKESISKGIFNGEDALDFTNVSEVLSVEQLIVVTNEQPIYDSSDRSILTLKHTPVSVINSIVNVTTGQRYVIENSNLDGSIGELNMTGRIKISGGTLPTSNDEIQASYIWNHSFDKDLEFDDLTENSVVRTAQDSIDFGFSNRVVDEKQTVLFSVSDNEHVIVEHPISRIVNVNKDNSESVVISSGKVTVANIVKSIFSITGVDGREIFYTKNLNGSFSGTEITFPTDAIYSNGDLVLVRYNREDIYSPDGVQNGSFSGNQINLPLLVSSAGDTVYVDYVANVESLLPLTNLSSLPVSGANNEFVVDNNLVGDQPVSNIYDINDNIISNIRYAPTFLKMNFQGVLSSGKMTIKGVSHTKVEQIITVRSDGLTIDLSDAIKQQLGVSTIPLTGYVALVNSIDRVTVQDNVVSSVDFSYDLINSQLNITKYSNGTSLPDGSIAVNSVKIDSTSENLENLPVTGQRLLVSFYFVDEGASERVSVTTSGIQFSRQKYTFVERLSIDAGFIGLSGNVEGTLGITSFNQPITSSTYSASYSYTAPKEGERITITYNYNRLISDALYLIEDVRPITADVLIKAATSVPVDISIEVVALATFRGGSQNLVQSITEAITTFVSGNTLGTVLDSSDIINATYSVTGVDRVELLTFNRSGKSGIEKSIEANRNEFITSGIINVTIVGR